MTVLFPAIVTCYIPYRLLSPIDLDKTSEWALGQYAGGTMIAAGVGILLTCVWEFAHIGRGTLAPFDEPRKLVVSGLYRYVRNPMYVGVMLILLGEAWFFGAKSLLIWAGLCFCAFNLFIMGYEEIRLSAKFGGDYEEYRRKVGRWIPRRQHESSHVLDETLK